MACKLLAISMVDSSTQSRDGTYLSALVVWVFEPRLFGEKLVLGIEDLECVVVVDAHAQQLIGYATIVPRLQDHATVAEKVNDVSLCPRGRVHLDDGHVHLPQAAVDGSGQAAEAEANDDHIQPYRPGV